MIDFPCPHCQSPLSADSDQEGLTITCSHCGQTATVGAVQETAAPSVESASPIDEKSARSASTSEIPTCRMCGQQITENVDQCPNCGEQLTGLSSTAEGDRPPYRSAHTLATLVLLTFGANALVGAVGGATYLQQWFLVNSAQAGENVQASLELTYRLAVAIDAVTAIVGLVGIITLLMWVYRANKNARALGATGMQFTPGWSVGWFFIPILNLWRPYQVVKEIWHKSDPVGDGSEVGGAALVGFWWCSWVINSFVGQVAGALATGANDIDSFIVSRQFNLFAMVVNLVVIALTIAVVRSITTRQTERHESLAR